MARPRRAAGRPDRRGPLGTRRGGGTTAGGEHDDKSNGSGTQQGTTGHDTPRRGAATMTSGRADTTVGSPDNTAPNCANTQQVTAGSKDPIGGVGAPTAPDPVNSTTVRILESHVPDPETHLCVVSLTCRGRPSWQCAGCGQPWPCRDRRDRLPASTRTVAPPSASTSACNWPTRCRTYPSAGRDLHARFLGWLRPT